MLTWIGWAVVVSALYGGIVWLATQVCGLNARQYKRMTGHDEDDL